MVALDEPCPVSLFSPRESIPDALAQFIDTQRRSLVDEGRARAQVSDGDHAGKVPKLAPVLQRIPGRFGDQLFNRWGARQTTDRMGWLRLAAPVDEPFTLVVKQPAAFTAALPQLAARFRCVALVRNPLATLASWNTVDFKRDGRARVAERIDPTLGPRLDAIKNRYRRQMELLSWFFERYRGHDLIRYEEMCWDPNETLSVVTPVDGLAPFESRNLNPKYSPYLIEKLATLLLNSDGAYWEVYWREEVRRLAASYL
ncbi:MAG: hypothetical protein JWL83_3979 [Actinomycetia bacterium]|nr:hypothetical protein [Actinomycetes bacterium]